MVHIKWTIELTYIYLNEWNGISRVQRHLNSPFSYCPYNCALEWRGFPRKLVSQLDIYRVHLSFLLHVCMKKRGNILQLCSQNNYRCKCHIRVELLFDLLVGVCLSYYKRKSTVCFWSFSMVRWWYCNKHLFKRYVG